MLSASRATKANKNKKAEATFTLLFASIRTRFRAKVNLETRHSTSLTLTRHLLEFCVLGFGLLQDGNVRVGVFPQREEILIRRARLGLIAGNCVGPPQLQMRQRSNNGIEHNTGMIQNLLKLGSSFIALVQKQVGPAAPVRTQDSSEKSKVVGNNRL